MPFTEEQEKGLIALVGMAEKLNALVAGQAAPAAQPPESKANPKLPQPAAAVPSVNVRGQVADDMRAEAEAARQANAMKEAITFNLTVQNLLKKYENVLPSTSARIVQTIDAINYSDEIARAHALQKNLLEEFLNTQENMNVLQGKFKEKAEKFFKLPADKKLSDIAEYWPLLEYAADRKQLLMKTTETQKANGEWTGRGDVLSDYDARIFSAGRQIETKEK